MVYHGYTIEEMCAIADAHGIHGNYGAVQKHLEYGAPLPPLREPVKWPKGSAHQGEMQLVGGQVINVQICMEVPKPDAHRASQKKPSGLHCNRCGGLCPSDSLQRVKLRYPRSSSQAANLAGILCSACAPKLLPMQRPTRQEKYPTTDDAGNRIGGRTVAKCHRCGVFHAKKEGAQIYTRAPGDDAPHLMGYLCAVCAPEFEAEIKKALPD